VVKEKKSKKNEREIVGEQIYHKKCECEREKVKVQMPQGLEYDKKM
jgi:hypothetical protein